MAYLTEQDLTDRIGADEVLRLADRDGDGVADSGVVSKAIAEAEGIIDSYLTGRYVLPLSPMPVILTSLAADLALYNLHPWGAPEEMRQRYKDAVTTLGKIAKGDMVLQADRIPTETIPQWGDAGPVLSDPRKRGF